MIYPLGNWSMGLRFHVRNDRAKFPIWLPLNFFDVSKLNRETRANPAVNLPDDFSFVASTVLRDGALAEARSHPPALERPGLLER